MLDCKLQLRLHRESLHSPLKQQPVLASGAGCFLPVNWFAGVQWLMLVSQGH